MIGVFADAREMVSRARQQQRAAIALAHCDHFGRGRGSGTPETPGGNGVDPCPGLGPEGAPARVGAARRFGGPTNTSTGGIVG
jgi:hypothetical protein